MILPNLQYPRFVPDQVLTSDNLDDLFTYLDDQDRITRTNLIGVGIVCGLGVETPPNGTSIKITKGTGITSEGYLVSHADTDPLGKKEIVYTGYIAFEDQQQVLRPCGLAGRKDTFDHRADDVPDLDVAKVSGKVDVDLHLGQFRCNGFDLVEVAGGNQQLAIFVSWHGCVRRCHRLTHGGRRIG